MRMSTKSNTLTNKQKLEETILGIPYVKSYKYLGVTFNQNIMASEHIDKIEAKLKKYKKMITILRFQQAPQNIFKFLYSTFAESCLHYACFTFSPLFANSTTI